MKSIFIVQGNATFKNRLFKLLEAMKVDFENVEFQDELPHIDYVILDGNAKYKMEEIRGSYCLINMDKCYQNNITIYGNVIAYGFGSKNTVTVSSVEDEKTDFVYCLQRYVNPNALGVLVPQEIPIHMEFKDDEELYAAMVAITIGLNSGLREDEIQKSINTKILIKR